MSLVAHSNEPFSILQIDGLPKFSSHQRALPSTQADELLHFMKTSPAAPLIVELSLQHRQTSSYYLSGRALDCTSHRRDPPHKTHLIDEPLSILQRRWAPSFSSHRRALPSTQANELLLFMKTSPAAPLIDELSLQRRQASSYSL